MWEKFDKIRTDKNIFAIILLEILALMHTYYRIYYYFNKFILLIK